MKLVLNQNSKDKLFQDKSPLAKFEFNEQVARVFDDMISRSVPFYEEVQRLIFYFTEQAAVEGTCVYDLGCSTGTTLIHLAKHLQQKCFFIGLDDSEKMLEQARLKAAQVGLREQINFINQSINEQMLLRDASVVIMSLTLQFIKPSLREAILQKIFTGLNKNGVFIVFEKILTESSDLNRLFVDEYYNFKRRNHYGEEEIAKKRESLENVLIPYRASENVDLFKKVGFEVVEPFFQWLNFKAFICVKR